MARRNFLKGAVVGACGGVVTSSCGPGRDPLPIAPLEPSTNWENFRPTLLRVTSAKTGEGIDRAHVMVPMPSGSFLTDADGHASIPVAERIKMDIRKEGYFNRETRSARNITLWQPTGPENLYQQILFGRGPTRRLQKPTLGFVFENGVPDQRVTEVFDEVVHKVEASLGGFLKIRLWSDDAQVIYKISVNPGDPVFKESQLIRGATYWNTLRCEILGGRIVFRDPQAILIRSLVEHEMYHSLGLHHVVGDYMMDVTGHARVAGLTEHELDALRLLYARPPGLVSADNDQLVT